MRTSTFEFQGETYELALTCEALFTAWEKYGAEDADLISLTHAGENTLEGWKGACWLGALLASQGELQRRWRGETPREMLSYERLRRTASPADMLALRSAIREALMLGFRRDNISDADAEVDAVLAERAAAEKKTANPAAAVLAFVRRLSGSSGSLSGRR